MAEVNSLSYGRLRHHSRMTFGERVKDLRKAAGISSTTKLARKIGISQPSMRAIEEDATDPNEIKTGNFMQLVDALLTNPLYLWTGVGPMGALINPDTEEAEAASLCRQLQEPYRQAWLAGGRVFAELQPPAKATQDQPFPGVKRAGRK